MYKQNGQSLQEMWGEDKIWVWDSAVYSEKNLKAFARETKTLTKKIEKEKAKEEKEVWHFDNQEFYNEEDGLKAAQEMEKRWKYHKISAIEVETKRKRRGRGRGRRPRASGSTKRKR